VNRGPAEATALFQEGSGFIPGAPRIHLALHMSCSFCDYYFDEYNVNSFTAVTRFKILSCQHVFFFAINSMCMSAEYLPGILVLETLVVNALETVSQQKFGTER
jgi:hypothetical protein